MNTGFLVRNAANLLFRRRLDFTFDHIPMSARNLSREKRWNLLKIGINRLFPVVRTLGRPYMAHVSPANVCDLACRICPAKDPATKGRELLPFDTFRKFVDEAGDTLLYIILWSWGEPLLNPDLPRMIRYAVDRNILTVTSTNLNRLTDEAAAALVKSGLTALIIAVDGVTPEVYEAQRRGGDLERVLGNIRRLVAAKRANGGNGPLLNLRMVVSRENEHQVDEFRRIGRDLGVDMVSFKAYSTRQDGRTEPERDQALAPQQERFRWYRYDRWFRPDTRPGRYRCRFPWTKPMLFPDGEILACEFDLQEQFSFGNIRERSFHDIWFSPAAEDFRRRFQKDRDSVAFCRQCVFDYRTIDGCVLSAEFVDSK